MEQRTLELQLVSALKYVNVFTKMDVYAVVSIVGDPYNGKQKTKTNVVPNCGTNPTFNFTMHFTLDDSLLTRPDVLSLEVKLVSRRLFGDRVIGIAHVRLKYLFDSADLKDMKLTTYTVRRPSGRNKGELSFHYKFREKVTVPKKSEPVMAYPFGTEPKSTGYPPMQLVKQKPPKSSGMGFGTGFLGGLVVGDLMSHGHHGCLCGGGGCGGGCGGGG